MEEKKYCKKDCSTCKHRNWWGSKPAICFLCNDKYSNWDLDDLIFGDD